MLCVEFCCLMRFDVGLFVLACVGFSLVVCVFLGLFISNGYVVALICWICLL